MERSVKLLGKPPPSHLEQKGHNDHTHAGVKNKEFKAEESGPKKTKLNLFSTVVLVTALWGSK